MNGETPVVARTGLCHSVIGEEADMSNEVENCRGREEEYPVHKLP